MVELENVGIGFAAVCGAGGATALGAAVVFFPTLVKLASKRVLASALGFSAGVMCYVSFVEIFQKSVIAFTDHVVKQDELDDAEDATGKANLYATLSFFLGVVIMILVDFIVKLLTKGEHTHDLPMGDPCVGSAEDPVAELNQWQRNADKEIETMKNKNENQTAMGSSNFSPRGSDSDSNMEAFDEDQENDSEKNEVVVENSDFVDEDHGEKMRLQNMGLQTAIAIALHNFPEGLATFVAVMDDPSVGLVLAVAIGIHNIPEGLCVSLPVYYASGNRFKAFLWGALSGVSEPIGALFGWLVFANAMSDVVFGLMFGSVAGMMIMISLRELLPTAHRYDEKDTVVSYSIIVGMGVMSLSLVLFYF